jgi:hypothetical protein
MSKYRCDFVTNSSSSSFIIAYKTLPEIDEETMKKYPFLKHYGEFMEKALFSDGDSYGCWETDKGEIYRSIEEWNEYIIDNWGWSKEPTLETIIEGDTWVSNMYNKAKTYLEKGYNILYKNVDYSDEHCIMMIESLDDGENFIVLEGE